MSNEPANLPPYEHNTLFFVLGFLDERQGRVIVEGGGEVERFFAEERIKADLFERYLTRLKTEWRLDDPVVRDISPAGSICFKSVGLSERINACYEFAPTRVSRAEKTGDYSAAPLQSGFVSASIFKNQGRNARVSFVAGAYARFGRGDEIRLVGAKHKAELLVGLFKELGCPAAALELANEGRIPEVWRVRFQPTEELKRRLAPSIPPRGTVEVPSRGITDGATRGIASVFGRMSDGFFRFVLKRRLLDINPVVFLMFFGLIWFGFAWLLWREVRRGDGGWIALILCAGVGVLVYWWAGYLFLRRYLPPADLEVGANAAPAGGSVEVTWEIGEGVEKIKRLKICLECQEEIEEDAQQDSPITNTSIRITPLASIVAKETTFTEEMAKGRVRLTVPQDARLTLNEGKRKIVWFVCLRGKTAWLPELSVRKEIVILPEGQARAG